MAREQVNPVLSHRVRGDILQQPQVPDALPLSPELGYPQHHPGPALEGPPGRLAESVSHTG